MRIFMWRQRLANTMRLVHATVFMFLLSSLGGAQWMRRVRAAEPLQMASFEVRIDPRVGKPLAYDPMVESTGPLSCRGIVLLPRDQSAIVLAAVDWLGVANEAQTVFKQKIARAAHTDPQRVLVHALHQHDAPRCDLTSAKILAEYGIAEQFYDTEYLIESMDRAAAAVEQAMGRLQPVTGLRYGRAKVQQVASNRRLIGPDGKVFATRYTACRDEKLRALPEGVIDPWLQMLIFESQSGPLAVLTFYATHPQSYYRTGQSNPDFIGMARDQRQATTGVPHVHFNGAGGNVGAGKYNDGAPANRAVLAERVRKAMREAWETAAPPEPIQVVDWSVVTVRLPLGSHLNATVHRQVLADEGASTLDRLGAAKKLALLQRHPDGVEIDVGRLRLDDQWILWMPGELFVEYQLAAQAMRPQDRVMMAAYGEYGTGYIGTRVAYPQGGYEVSERASNVAPESEFVLVEAMRQLLEVDKPVWPSEFTETRGSLP
ncbi:MAG: hypothetical protein KatS3mg111_1136 [Pirellulaceae bacterium]|nr:MAG: hypothetical protein KatS3mg111_1136 [Pirellulaceae bacterium]